MFSFTSLLGAKSTSSASSSLLELEGGVKILIDVGWDETFDGNLLAELEKNIPSISLILLTHATTSHLGAFAHCCKHFPQFSSIPIYATAPVISLGRALLQDIYASNPLAASVIPQNALDESTWASGASARSSKQSQMLLQPPTTDEIIEYFQKIRPLKYSQPHEPEASPLSPPLNGLTITAYSAGHSLGGTIWHIQHGLESVVYAVDWNQAKDSALQSAAWLSSGGTEVIESLRRPTALVSSTRCSQRFLFPGGRERRDEHMLQLIQQTVANGGSVLIPSDTCGRALELAYVLEEAWEREKPGADSPQSLRNANAYFASASGGLTMRFAKSMLEWMDEEIVKDFETAGHQMKQTGNQAAPRTPFDFKHLRIVERKKQFQKMLAYSGPKVILASDVSLEWGYGRTLFHEFASKSENLIILPQPAENTATGRNSISHSLWNIWTANSPKLQFDDEASLTRVVEGSGMSITYTEVSTEALVDSELAIYQQYLARERQRHWELNANKSSTLRGAGGDDTIDDNASSSSEESEESDGEQQGKVLNVSATLNHARHKAALTDAELGIDILTRRKGHYDYDVRGKRGRERMFPVAPPKRVKPSDDYGEIIRAEDYLRAEEKEETENTQTAVKNEKDGGLGQKRKWGDLSQLSSSGLNATNGTSKRRRATERSVDETLNTDSGYSTLGNPTDLDDDSDDDTDEPVESTRIEGPVKAVLQDATISIHIRIAYADFSGLHDKRSMQMLIPLIKPRKLVLIGGNEPETMALRAECEKLLGTDSNTTDHVAEIFSPSIGETLDASVDTNAWNVKLGVLLRQKLNWQTVGALGVVPLTGHLHTIALSEGPEQSTAKRIKSDETPIKDEEMPDVTNGQPTVPVLDLVPSTTALSAVRTVARPIHVGDLRLSDLRKLMQSSGVPAEFRGEGTLLVNNQVAVRKSAVGKIEVESVIGIPGYAVTDPTFDMVRKKIYAGLAVISGAATA